MDRYNKYKVEHTLHSCTWALYMIPQKPIVYCFDLPPTMDKVLKAIKQTSSG